MAQQLDLSGTLGCPNCKLGNFQPGNITIDAACLCIGHYIINGHMFCVRDMFNQFQCTKSYTVTKGAPQTCNCLNPARAAPFASGPVNCPCSPPNCTIVRPRLVRQIVIT